MNKRGFSHIEMIMAFILFVAAVVFGLYFFNPSDNTRLVDSSLNYATNAIIENISINLITYSVAINNTNSQISINAQNTLAVPIRDVPSSMILRVEDYHGGILPSIRYLSSSSDTVRFNKNGSNWEQNDFVLMRFSDVFAPYSINSLPLTESNESYYAISSFKSDNVLSEDRILRLNQSYNSNYDSLREAFNIKRADFGFKLVLPDKVIIAERSIPPKGEVFSKNLRLKIIRSGGQIEFADLIIEVW